MIKSTTLRLIRVSAGFSEAEISRATGIRPELISRIETGTIRPGKKHRERLCRFFRMDEATLFPDLELKDEEKS